MIVFKSLVLFFFCGSIAAVNLPFADEALLISCQATGHALFINCVIKLPIKPDDVASCVALKTTYVICLSRLNAPYPLMMAIDPDPYSSNPFSPCYYETGHVALYDICPSIP